MVGGGYIAVEFAGIFNGLGAAVTQLYRGPLFLRGFDEDVRTVLAEEITKSGVDLRFEAKIARIEKTGDGLAVHSARWRCHPGRSGHVRYRSGSQHRRLGP